MRKHVALLFCSFLFCYFSKAQLATVKGTITDTAEHKSIANAVITLSRKSDSTLIAFTRADKEGNFQLFQIPIGTYKLLITFPQFADFSDTVNVKDSMTNLNPLALTAKSVLLKEVIVRSAGAVHIKGDTTEFTADSFAVKDGATVEDLLKKLPGFQVNSKGEITAQGKRVDKVLVDGEEFFGDDPTMATQNLGAKQVDKVQLFDTKTEQQKLTGIGSGNEGKTLNIKLKENSKRGSFGKINAGTDFNKYADAKALYNRFRGKKKVSVYGTGSNVNTGSLNWDERQKYGIEDDGEYDEVTDTYTTLIDNSDFENWNARGFPHSYSAGGLYIDKWNDEKQSVNTSYRYNRLQTDNQNSIFTKNILPNTVNYRNVFTNSNALNQQHAAFGKWEWKVDSLTSFKFTTVGTYRLSDIASNVNSAFLNANQDTVNTSLQDRLLNGTRTKWDNQLLYKQLFKKKDRQLLASLRYGITDDAQRAMNRTATNFYRDNVMDSLDLIDQLRVIYGHSNSMGIKVTYTEPLSQKWSLVFDYAHNRSNASSYRNTYNKNDLGKYEALDTVFSNNFNFDAYGHSGMGLLRYADKKFKATIGSGLSSVKLQLNNLDEKTRSTYHFTNYRPQVQLQLTPKPQTRFSLNYYGFTRQPTIDQLQPIRNNDDPLYQFQGNPNLKVGFNHRFQVWYNQFKLLKQRYVYGNFSYNIFQNAITTFVTIDTVLGKQISTPVNVNGNRSWNSWMGWFKQGGPKKWGYGLNFNGDGGVNNNFVQQNGVVVKNRTTYNNFNVGIDLNYQEEEKKSIGFRPSIGYTMSKQSIQPGVKTNYFTYGGNINGFVMLPGKLELSTDVNLNYQQRLPQFPAAQNFTIWNASLSRKVFKKKTGKFIFEANDILNQNRGINRTVNSSFIQEERYNRIARYFLLRFEWSFNKLPGSDAPSK